MRTSLYLLTILAALGVVFQGCSKDEKETERPSGIYVRATIPAVSLNTRYSSDGATLNWTTGDNIGVYYIPEGLGDAQKHNNVRFTLYADAGKSTSDFSPASSLNWATNAARQTFYAIYPYSESYGADPTEITVLLDGKMWRTDGSKVLGDTPLLIASQQYTVAPDNERVDMDFVNPLNILTFDINVKNTVLADETVQSVSVELDQDIVGDVTVDLTTGIIEGGSSGSLTYNGIVTFEDGKFSLSASVLPGEETGTLTGALTVNTDNYMLVVDTVDFTVEAGEANNVFTAEVDVQELLANDKAVIVDNDTVNLSSEEVANTYIVSKTGTYTFDARIPSEDGTGTIIEGITGASWAWMTGTEGNIIPGNSIEYDDETGKITFTIAAFRPGSVVISAHDAEKTILWNWHIWVTDMFRGTFNTGDMMPYNIGATSYDRTLRDYTTLGHYYQWGQPYPLIGSGVHDLSEGGDPTYGDEIEPFKTSTAPNIINTAYFPLLEWNYWLGYFVDTGEVDVDGEPVYEFVRTEPYAQNDYKEGVKLPTKFYISLYNLPAQNQYVWPQMADPCPPGWRIPTVQEVGAYFGISEAGTYTRGASFDLDYLGAVPTSHSDHWWPFAGHRWNQSAGVYKVGQQGVYHTADRTTSESGLLQLTTAAILLNGSDQSVTWCTAEQGISSHTAASVRCIKK